MHTVFYIWIEKNFHGIPSDSRWCLATLAYNWEAGETIPEFAERIWNIAKFAQVNSASYVEPRTYKLF